MSKLPDEVVEALACIGTGPFRYKEDGAYGNVIDSKGYEPIYLNECNCSPYDLAILLNYLWSKYQEMLDS